jgi:DNA-directed RNA polymerase specialized sigma24 family protein
MKPNLLFKSSPYAHCTDREVIYGLKQCKNDLERDAYYSEFYNRYARYVYYIVYNSCRINNIPNPTDSADDITQEIFIKLNAKLKDFVFSNEPDLVIDKRKIKAWIGVSANRILIREIIKLQNGFLNVESLEMPIPVFEHAGELKGSPITSENVSNYKLLERALEILSEDERIIVLTYAAEGCICSTKHLSVGAMEFLTNSLNTSSGTIRQKKRRALDKILSFMGKK